MSVARKRYTPDEKAQIVKLAAEGWSYKDIAEKLRPDISSAWRSIGEIVREAKKAAECDNTLDASESAQTTPTVPRPSLIQTANGSPVTLPDELKDSVTAKEIMGMLDDEQRTIFVATYEDLRGQADDESITSAENDMLIRAALAHTQYLRAARMHSQCETYLLEDLEGNIPDPGDPRKRMAGRGDTYKKDMESKHKEYMDLIGSLKLNRSQRLDKIKDTRNTLLDLQAELSSRDKQGSIIEDIKRINNATIEEFRRMSKGELGPDGARHPWLIGSFEHYLGETPDGEE